MKLRRESSTGGVGVSRSDERLRQFTNEQGQTLAKAHRERAEQMLKESVSMEQMRAKPEQSFPTSKPIPPAWVQVGLDGGWVPSREQKGGMEGKIGVVASHVDPVGKHGRHRLNRRR